MKSRSVSEEIFSIDWPVLSDRIWSSRSRIRWISRAWISMSTDWPSAPPDGWWIRMRLWGSANRFPLAPAANSTAAADAACPMQNVDTSGLMKSIVSRIASALVTEPPGELMYSAMSLSGSSPSRWSSWAIIRLAISSLIGVPRKMMRSLSSRE